MTPPKHPVAMADGQPLPPPIPQGEDIPRPPFPQTGATGVASGEMGACSGPHRTRFGVAFRLIGGLAAILLLMSLAIGLSMFMFGRLHQGFAQMSAQHLPLLVVATQMAQQSESIVANAPNLVAAEKHVDRHTIALRIADQVSWLDELLRRLTDIGVESEIIGPLKAHKGELVDNLDLLNKQVEKRIDADERSRRHNQTILRLRQELRDQEITLLSLLPERDETNSEVVAWMTAIRQWARESQATVVSLLAAAGASRPGQVSRLQVEAQESLRSARNVLLPLPEVTRSTAEELSTRLEALVEGDGGVFATRLRQLDASAGTAGILSHNKVLAERFVNVVSGLSRRLQEGIDNQSRATAATIVDVSRLITGIVAICLLSGFLIFLYISRQVVGRLEEVRRAMAAHVDGQPVPFVTTGRDEIADIARSAYFFVTGLHRRGEALAAAKDEAEAANRAKSTFLAAMSHEIRTPMNGVVTMAELLEQTSLNREQRGMAAVIRESAAALLTIINDILDFSKIEADRMELERVPCAIADIVEGVADLLAPRAEEKQLDIIVRIAAEVPPLCLGDPVRLRQILVNLAGNAVKFTPAGHVLLTVAVVPAPGRTSRLRFAVHDTGIGISPEQQARLFRPFMQAEISTARQFGGTGLGLSICHRLIQLMGGQIGVDSHPGQGSLFWFEVPLQSLPDSGETLPLPPDIAGTRVLLLSPRTAFLAHTAASLEEAGAIVTTGENDDTALAALRRNAFEVVLIDHALNGAGGLNFARRCHEALLAGSARRVLMQPRTHTLAPGEMEQAGLFAVVALPLRQSALRHTIAAALGRVALAETAPVSQSRQTYRPPTVEEARAVGALVLVAEDNPTNQIVIRKLLDRLGYAADMSNNGVEALARWQSGHYGLLLTDCHMPEMNGYELTQRIRVVEQAAAQRGIPLRRLPIIALTADALAGTAQVCLDAGMDAYLSKPVDMRQLDTVLRRWLPQGTALRRPERAADAPPPAPGLAATMVIDADLLDTARLAAMSGAINPAAIELLTSFLTSIEPLATELDERPQNPLDPPRLNRLVAASHAAKGAALSVGCPRLGRLLEDLDVALAHEDLPAITALTAPFMVAFTATRQAAATLAEMVADTANTSVHISGSNSCPAVPVSSVTASPSLREDALPILVAEDHPTSRALLVHQLRQLGHPAIAAADGAAAFEAWCSRPYRMLITDGHMPHVDGFELARLIRTHEKPGHARTAIVALTATLHDTDRRRCLEAGIDDLVLKPVTLKQLSLVLARWLGSSAVPRLPGHTVPPLSARPLLPPRSRPPAAGIPGLADATSDVDVNAVAQRHLPDINLTAGIMPEEDALPLLDLDHVRSVFGMLDDGAVEMLHLFIDSSAPLLDAIGVALGDTRPDSTAHDGSGDSGNMADIATARAKAHALAGAARTAGARALAASASALEVALVENNPADIQNHLATVRTLFPETAVVIAEILPDSDENG